jgi:hypothetical protein
MLEMIKLALGGLAAIPKLIDAIREIAQGIQVMRAEQRINEFKVAIDQLEKAQSADEKKAAIRRISDGINS